MQIQELFLCLYFAIALRYLKSALETLTYEIFASCTGEMIKIQTGLLWGLNEKNIWKCSDFSNCWLNEWLHDFEKGKLLTSLYEIN